MSSVLHGRTSLAGGKLASATTRIDSCPWPPSTRLADLPLEIEGYELQGLEHQTPGFERLSTMIHLWGDGEDGLGEDVTYDALDHIALQDAGPSLDLTGYATLGEFCDFVGDLDTFPAEPQREVSRRYRRWAFESAALDLALRQAGIGIAEALGREPRPVDVRLLDAPLPPAPTSPPRSRPCAASSTATRPCASSSTRPTTGTTS